MQPQRAKLPTWEISSYVAIWTGAVLYGIYRLYVATNKYFQNYYDTYDDFSPGWSFLNRKLDTSDEEWTILIPQIRRLIPWIIAQVFISQSLKLLFKNTTLICAWYCTISITFLWYHFGFFTVLCTLLLPCISCLLTSIRSKTISWLVHSITIALIFYVQVSYLIFRKWLMHGHDDFFLLHSLICWMQLKSISYSIDSIDTYKHVNIYGFFKDLLQNVAYCLHLPTLFLGPVILYQQFIDGINKPFIQWNAEKSLKIFLNLVRYAFWMYFTEFFLHFLYFNALKFHSESVMRLDPWAFYGFGYCMGQYFSNKYIVFYGLSSTICRAEDIDAPPQPKCIGRIHLYSDMWKHFDRGLYEFLLRYIYIPCNPNSPFRKIFASALCFTFIYLWHGMHLHIFFWSFLNFLGIVIELLVKSNSLYFYNNILHESLSLQNRRRLECAISSPLLALSAISNFYFFAEEVIGHIYMWRIFNESWKVSIVLLFILYCCCQTSTEVKQTENVNSVKSRRDN